MDTIAYNVYRTYDYDKFKVLLGNRTTTETDRRVQNMMVSIRTLGFIRNPIIVNKRFEVVDGQSRYYALKNLAMPIEYIIDDNIGTPECIGMNTGQKNWALKDFIFSYSELGNKNYVRFLGLMDRYRMIPMYAIYDALVVSSVLNFGKDTRNECIKKGTLICTEEDMERVITILEYVNMFSKYINEIGGRTDQLFCALVYAYHFEKIDNDRLFDSFKKRYRDVTASLNLKNAFDALSDIYNRHSRNMPVDLSLEYKIYKYNQKKVKE